MPNVVKLGLGEMQVNKEFRMNGWLKLLLILALTPLAATAAPQAPTMRKADELTTRSPSPVGDARKPGGRPLVPYITVGSDVPDLRFRDEEGSLRRLSEFKGRVLAMVWLMPEAANNKRLLMAGRVQELSKLPPEQVTVVHVKESLTTHTYEWPAPDHPPLVFSDGRYLNGMRFGINKLPSAVIIDRDGRLAYRGALDNDPLGTLPDEQRASYAADALRQVVNGEAVTTASTALHGDPLLYMPRDRQKTGVKTFVTNRQKAKSP